ncbi:AMMECR1 domain-containing protein [Candidatus Woesearchaeota archaeon]|jgi:hypothetical protein|nr:AMMECR1 domain-containing protein [Candidatus Woesearchaeota archaeon]|tara:strand:- start:604 stop:1152 length:549 start_codon:yes stop_codon:yes gene_type:complete
MNEQDKILLLNLVRKTIDSSFKRKEPDINDVLHLKKERGVFVTLHKLDQLRGCIGFPEPIMPLYKAVIEATKGAAFNDSRFPVVSPDELRDIKIEISVLTKPELIKVDKPIDYYKNIYIGLDGLIIRTTTNSGLLLPQVASENNFTVNQFLNALCQKANLSFTAWQNLNNQIFKFQAEIFSE